MNERLDEFVNLFPVHPDYIDTFEQVSAVEKRQILKSLSISMNKLMAQVVPKEYPALVAYDSYWKELSADAGYRTIPDIREVINVSNVLHERISRSFTRPAYQDMALRIIDEADKGSVSRVRGPLLARALFFTGDIGADVAEDLFSAVASVLAYVLQLERGANPSFEDPKLPSDLLYDEFGAKLWVESLQYETT